MSDNKLEGLIARLEAAVEKMEKSQGGDKFANLVNSLEKSVLKLENLHGGNQAPQTKTAEPVKAVETQAQTPTPKPAVPEADRFHPFDEQYNEWFEKAKTSGNQDLIAMVTN